VGSRGGFVLAVWAEERAGRWESCCVLIVGSAGSRAMDFGAGRRHILGLCCSLGVSRSRQLLVDGLFL